MQNSLETQRAPSKSILLLQNSHIHPVVKSNKQKFKHERQYLLYCPGIGTPALDAALDQHRLSGSLWVSADCGQSQVRSAYAAECQGRSPSSHSTELSLHFLPKRKRKPHYFIIHQMLKCHCLLNTKCGECTQLPL